MKNTLRRRFKRLASLKIVHRRIRLTFRLLFYCENIERNCYVYTFVAAKLSRTVAWCINLKFVTVGECCAHAWKGVRYLRAKSLLLPDYQKQTCDKKINVYNSDFITTN